MYVFSYTYLHVYCICLSEGAPLLCISSLVVIIMYIRTYDEMAINVNSVCVCVRACVCMCVCCQLRSKWHSNLLEGILDNEYTYVPSSSWLLHSDPRILAPSYVRMYVYARM